MPLIGGDYRANRPYNQFNHVRQAKGLGFMALVAMWEFYQDGLSLLLKKARHRVDCGGYRAQT